VDVSRRNPKRPFIVTVGAYNTLTILFSTPISRALIISALAKNNSTIADDCDDITDAFNLIFQSSTRTVFTEIKIKWYRDPLSTRLLQPPQGRDRKSTRVPFPRPSAPSFSMYKITSRPFVLELQGTRRDLTSGVLSKVAKK
jgi:hypothetical protein